MILETNEYFIITDPPQTISNPNGLSMKLPCEFDGIVFKAALVEGDYVAAEVVERDLQKMEKPVVFSLNHTRYDIITVSERYALTIMNSRKIAYNQEEDIIRLLGGDPGDNHGEPPTNEGDGPYDNLF